MSGERLTAKELNNSSGPNYFTNEKKSKVDINDLLNKIRVEKNKKKRGNYIFFGLICAVLTVTGIIASF